jgi:hypothetical protein
MFSSHQAPGGLSFGFTFTGCMSWSGSQKAPVQEATGETVAVAYVDQGYTGQDAVAAAQGVRLEVVKLPAAKHGVVLLPSSLAAGWSSGTLPAPRAFTAAPATTSGCPTS